MAFRYTKSGGLQSIFVNGAHDTTGIGHSPFIGTDYVKVGRWNNGSYFYGTIDEVYFFSRALSDAEIEELYTGIYVAGQVPVPISPINNNLVNSHDVNFLWHSSDSAVSYHIQVTPDSTFGGVEFEQ
jgi:hypothetical protein